MSTYIEYSKVSFKGIEHNVPIIRFEPYKDITWLTHGFSTRLGGVSEGIYSSMNLSFSQGDNYDTVYDNHCIFSKALNASLEESVYSHQTHTTNVMKVTKEHAGMGFVRPRNFENIDGLVTNEPGLTLVTSYADCVPLYFVDVKNRAIGLSHSGWRGTVNNIAKNTIELMKAEYGTDPSDVVAFIGPSICRDCFEVDMDVASVFLDTYRESGLVTTDEADVTYIVSKNPYIEQNDEQIDEQSTGEKYLVNLQAANCYNMMQAGVPDENIHITDICTCCNPHILFSHRASKGKRGGMCAFLKIEDM